MISFIFVYGMALQEEIIAGWYLGVFFFLLCMGSLFLRLQHVLMVNEYELTLKTFFKKRTILLTDIAFITIKDVRHGRGSVEYVCLLDKERRELASFYPDLIMQKNKHEEAIEFLLFIQERGQTKLSDSLQIVYHLRQHHIPTDKDIPMIKRINRFMLAVFFLALAVFLYIFILYIMSFFSIFY